LRRSKRSRRAKPATPVVAQTSQRLGAAMVNIRSEGWKELKVGCVFALAPQTVLDSQTQEPVEQGHAPQITYVAPLGAPDELGQRLWAQAQQRSWEQATATQGLGDGAAWIWQLRDLYFAPHQQPLDWPHATDHLQAAAQL
jgi:hypothetical protein